MSLHPNQRAENESGPQARLLTKAPQQKCVLYFWPGPRGLRGTPEGTPRPSDGVSATSRGLPEAPGIHHDPNQQKNKPNRIDEAIEQGPRTIPDEPVDTVKHSLRVAFLAAFIAFSIPAIMCKSSKCRSTSRVITSMVVGISPI